MSLSWFVLNTFKNNILCAFLYDGLKVIYLLELVKRCLTDWPKQHLLIATYWLSYHFFYLLRNDV